VRHLTAFLMVTVGLGSGCGGNGIGGGDGGNGGGGGVIADIFQPPVIDQLLPNDLFGALHSANFADDEFVSLTMNYLGPDGRVIDQLPAGVEASVNGYAMQETSLFRNLLAAEPPPEPPSYAGHTTDEVPFADFTGEVEFVLVDNGDVRRVLWPSKFSENPYVEADLPTTVVAGGSVVLAFPETAETVYEVRVDLLGENEDGVEEEWRTRSRVSDLARADGPNFIRPESRTIELVIPAEVPAGTYEMAFQAHLGLAPLACEGFDVCPPMYQFSSPITTTVEVVAAPDVD